MISLHSPGMTHLQLGNDIILLSICVMLCDRSLKANYIAISEQVKWSEVQGKANGLLGPFGRSTGISRKHDSK